MKRVRMKRRGAEGKVTGEEEEEEEEEQRRRADFKGTETNNHTTLHTHKRTRAHTRLGQTKWPP